LQPAFEVAHLAAGGFFYRTLTIEGILYTRTLTIKGKQNSSMKQDMHSAWSTTRFLSYITPSVLSIFTVCLYMVVDAIFISRYAGTLAMAAVNIILPLFSLCFGVGIMMAAGASALVGIEIGQQKTEKARQHFTLGFLFLLAAGTATLALMFGVGAEQIALMLGASEKLLPYCVSYLQVFAVGISVIMLQIYLEFFIRVDGKPIWSFYLTLAGGITNLVLDYIFIVNMDMGIHGAGIASSVGICVASLVGVCYFLFQAGTLEFTMPRMDVGFIKDAIINGSSEMVTEFSSGVKTLIFNRVVLAYAGEAGVAAMTILIYLYFLFTSFYIGLSMGTSPLISINYGSSNTAKLRELVWHSVRVTAVASVCTFFVTLCWGWSLITLFTAGREDVTAIAQAGLPILAVAFLVTGFNIISSAYFTAFNNGKVSALISLLRSFAFTIGLVTVLPPILGLKGVWYAITLAELLTLGVTLIFAAKYWGRYLGGETAPVGG